MRILIIDDDKDCLEDIATALEPSNYDCNTEISAIKAIKRYKEEHFDVVITDIKMPEMNGIEVLKKIKSIDNEARVIIITGYGDLETAVAAINNHAYAFFGKPINFNDLIKSLRNIEFEIKSNKKIEVDYNHLKEEYKKMKNTYNDLLTLVNNLKKNQ